MFSYRRILVIQAQGAGGFRIKTNSFCLSQNVQYPFFIVLFQDLIN